ncbi:MAG TPA: 4-hydroxy-tetrahydrodipicolinate reductase, partial [Alphaproteobacteria bacterium]|nr:4-hydroxy-tetrahydrodipicolinate reductase [Alphaproteobacteria bacterium]
MLNTVIVGAAGRMGQTLARMVHEDPCMNLMGGTEHAGHPKIGDDLGDILGLGQLNVTLTSEIEHVFAAADAVIDFTGPEASCRHATLAAQARIIHVIGTTGFNAEQEAIIARAAHHATIIKSGNMSLGVNLLAALVEKTARLLDEEFDIEVLEMHHRHK